MKLEVGLVYQYFYNKEINGPYILKSLPFNTNSGQYWDNRVNLYTLNDKWSHVAHIDTLKNNKNE